ncbi:N-acetyltransferase GCN5 [Bradyrhizobium sp. SSBR45G]|uniref:GNAT family N-acetyltransferase n=1 Tax=unclassified Bradyrhizobium TaxID=2631580 RepID=UPI0023429F18|nr:MULTISPECIES: GNAT family N-acetyltransferase [unclassified Bradyrhizobium]GLH76822.1 N-acetyltransferase GCN5 [Bradyrhizobium sp. SSBR45G]GLH83580.1 N-acetyltransferase GCN5 [Bradyrhizobium sp. SSBR45R]
MLQDITTPTLREARPCVLETPRLTLRPPVLADVAAIARLADDRRIAENTRRLPHPYSEVDAARFVRALEQTGETAFLIEHLDAPIGIVGINRSAQGRAELGYWLGVEHWGRGFGTEAARAAIDYFFEESEDDVLIGHARVSNPASRNILEKCGFQWTGVELHRFDVLGSSAPVDAFRLTRGVWASLKAWANTGRRG